MAIQTCLGVGGSGFGCFNVIAPDECCWTARIFNPLIFAEISSGSDGCGNGQVCYSVGFSRPGDSHLIEIVVINQTFRLSQFCPPCSQACPPGEVPVTPGVPDFLCHCATPTPTPSGTLAPTPTAIV